MSAPLATTGDVPAPSPALAPPPGDPRFPLFDSLRGLAVLAVLVFHAAILTGAAGDAVAGRAAIMLGNLGPVLFFAISGFLLYRPWAAALAAGAPAPSARRYARRRALRILPAYWVALTVLAAFPGLLGVFSGDWWRFYGFLQLYAARTLGRGLPVAWTLCVEVSFYVALPLWALAMRRATAARPSRWLRLELAGLLLVAALGAAVQVAAARQSASQIVATSLLGQCLWVALGMALAVTSVAVAQRGSPRALRAAAERPEVCWATAAAAFAALVTLVPGGGLLAVVRALGTRQSAAETLLKLALTAVVVVALLLPAVFAGRRRGLPRRLLAWRPLAWLGLVSYGVYLWHLPIAELLALRTSPHFTAAGLDLTASLPAPTVALLILTLAASCAIAWASYRVVELPFLRRKER